MTVRLANENDQTFGLYIRKVEGCWQTLKRYGSTLTANRRILGVQASHFMFGKRRPAKFFSHCKDKPRLPFKLCLHHNYLVMR